MEHILLLGSGEDVIQRKSTFRSECFVITASQQAVQTVV